MPAPSPAWLREYFDPGQLAGGLRGVEREALRVDAAGRLARTPHPAAIGSALTHELLTTDYSEALLEFVTPPFRTNREALDCLVELHAFVQRRIGGELLWPASMPCIDADDEAVPIADYGTSNEGMFRTVYRRGLGHRYGRAMQAIAGVHFNYSPSEAIWDALAAVDGHASPPTGFRSERLMGLVRNYRRLAWVVAYLFGASPVIAKSFRPGGHVRLESLDRDNWYAPYATSLRMSDLGYRNTTQSGPDISVNSLQDYVTELRAAVDRSEPAYAAIGVEVDGEYRQLNANVLQIENEYYSSIRPKPKDRKLRPVAALTRDGVEYVELRNLDSDPEALVGVEAVQMCTSELLLLMCLLEDSPPIQPAEQAEIDRRELEVAWDGRRPGLKLERGGCRTLLSDWGFRICDRLDCLAESIGTDEHRRAAVAARAAFGDPDATPSARMVQTLKLHRTGFKEYGLKLGYGHREALEAFELPPQREAALDTAAAASLEAQQTLEARPGPRFAEFLAAYFAQ